MPGYVRQRGTYKDGTAKYQARWRHPLDPGILREKSIRGASKGAHKRWLKEQDAAALNGDYLDPRRADRTLNDVVDLWRASWPGRLQPRTTERYESIIRTHVAPTFGKRKASGVTHEDVQRWVNRLRDSGLSAGTVRKAHAVFSAVMTEAARLGLVRANPCQHVRLPRVEHREMLFLTAGEVTTLADAMPPHYRTLIYTAAYTGLRASEPYALQRQHVDLLRGTLRVERALADTNGKLTFGPTKTHAKRTVKLPRFLRDMLEEHLTRPSPGGTGPAALIFPTVSGRPTQHRLVYGRYFRPTVRALVDAGELPAEKQGLRFHDLRHTAASFLIAAGAHPKAIQERLGHQTITMTLDRYGHLLPSLGDELADALDGTYEAASAPDDVVSIRD